MATLHLLHGFICSGKTTVAKKLELEKNAIRFTHDEWMCKLYGVNPPAEMFDVYFTRIENLIWQYCHDLIKLSVDVIIDFGFWSKLSRIEASQRAKAMGANAIWYKITCSDSTMFDRLLKRKSNIDEGILHISCESYEKLKIKFEPMQSDEDAILINTETV